MKLRLDEIRRESDENDIARERMAAARKLKQASNIDASEFAKWPEPQPLITKTEPGGYPITVLPDDIQGVIEEVQQFVQAPVPVVASSVLAAMSLAIQSYVDVQRDEKLDGPTSLFILTIADSGERKSSCDGYFTSAIKDFEKAEAIKAKPEIQDYKADLKAWTARGRGMEEKIRQLSKDGKPTSAQEAALRDLEREKPEPPKVPRLYYSDVTPEALAYLLSTEWPSGGVVSSEAGAVFGSHGMGKESAMRNLALLNQLWDGGTMSVDRRTSESFVVHGARLTMALQIQESTLREFFRSSGELARGTGFLARFLIAWPESTQGRRPFKASSKSWPALAEFNKRITEILSEPAPIEEDGSLKPTMMTMTAEAKSLWIGYYNDVEAQLSSGGALYDVRDVASKSADNTARLAALFAKYEGRTIINKDSMESAVTVSEWHLNESLRFFGELTLPVEMADAVKLDQWLIDYCKAEKMHSVSKRHAQQFGPVRQKERLSAAINELVNLDRLDVRKEGKRVLLHVNPALLAAA